MLKKSKSNPTLSCQGIAPHSKAILSNPSPQSGIEVRGYSGRYRINLKFRIFLLTLSFALVFGTSFAQNSVNDLQNNITEKQRRLDQIATEIQNLQKEIIGKQRQAASLKNEVVLFDLQIRQTEAEIEKVQLEIDELARKILETQIAIESRVQQIEDQKIILAETLRLINEYDSVSTLELTLANKTFSEFLDQVQYTTNLQEKTQEILDSIKKLKAELEAKNLELSKSLVEQENLRSQLTTTRQSLENQRGHKQNLLTTTRGQEKIYQSLLSDAAKKQEEVEREIFELEVTIRQRLGDKTLPPISGLLRWPMSGILTQGYGNTGFTALGYNFHNGIDIAAPAGTKIYSAGDGIVFATGTGQAAYGNWVVIKHTLSQEGKIFNIYTLYAHLQSISVSPNQAIRAGDLVGFEGNSGNTTRLLYGPERGYHLHFSIFDEEGFGIKDGAFENLYGSYRIPFGYTYNPLNFLGK